MRRDDTLLPPLILAGDVMPVPSLARLPLEAAEPPPDPVWAALDKMVHEASRNRSGQVDWMWSGGYSFCTDGRVLRDGTEVDQIEAGIARGRLREMLDQGQR